MKRKPTAFLAICHCSKIIGALDYERADHHDVGRILGSWLGNGWTVKPQFTRECSTTIEPCQCAVDTAEGMRPGPQPGSVGKDSVPSGAASAVPAAPAHEQLVRYCPGCGGIGPVDPQYDACCPDHEQARMIPQPLAQRCQATFQIAIRNLLSDEARAFSSAASSEVH